MTASLCRLRFFCPRRCISWRPEKSGEVVGVGRGDERLVEDHIFDNVVILNHHKRLRLLEVFHHLLHAPQPDARQAEIEQDLGGKETEAQPELLVVSRSDKVFGMASLRERKRWDAHRLIPAQGKPCTLEIPARGAVALQQEVRDAALEVSAPHLCQMNLRSAFGWSPIAEQIRPMFVKAVADGGMRWDVAESARCAQIRKSATTHAEELERLLIFASVEGVPRGLPELQLNQFVLKTKRSIDTHRQPDDQMIDETAAE
ncbi:hypothetical protein B0H13DRAFT_1911026 [Mycena leptocephala]|nr:hypothetical protein B0H13DRAFT_1911026 [Mycena leptocephala]